MKNTKVALVNPRVESYSSTLPPLGLLYIAALLEKHGYLVRIFDIYPYDDRDIEGLIHFNPDVIGMTVLTDYWPRARHIAAIIREKLRDSTFIIGGVHVTALAEKSIAELDAHIGVIGEGEYTVLEICDRLEDNLDWRSVKGIIYRDNSAKPVMTPPRPYIENLDELAFPARHLLNFENYLVPPGMIRGYWLERSTTVMTSRGCPFECIWCGSQCTFGRKVRYRSIDNVIDEIQALIDKFSVDAIWFVDDTFTLDKNRVFDFCHKLNLRKIRLTWGCQAHVKTADEKMFKAMRSCGLVQLDFGVESGSSRVLRSLKKNSDEESIIKAFSMAKKAGVRTCATFMFGSPAEIEEDVEATFRLAKKINPNFTSAFFITPYPGTELMEMAEKNNWTMAPDRYVCGLKKGPLLMINFTEKELMAIRERFQRNFSFRNFFSLLISPDYFFKALKLFLRYPAGLFSANREFLKTLVLDDFFFAFLIYYVGRKSASKE